MPSSCSRSSAADRSASRIRSPALSCATRSPTESHSGVAYSGCEPTSRYSRAPFSRKTFEERPQWTTRRNRYRATSSGDRRRCPRNVQVTPYSFSMPKMRRSIVVKRTGRRKERREGARRRSAEVGADLVHRQATERAPLGAGAVEHTGLQLLRWHLPRLGNRCEQLHGRADRGRKVPAGLEAIAQGVGELLGVPAHRDVLVLVGDGAVEQDVVDRRAAVVTVDLAHKKLDLVGLHLLREDRGQRLRVRVGEVSCLHVLSPVLVAAEVGEPDARDSELLELRVLPDAGERDLVEVLVDLVQPHSRVPSEEQQAFGVFQSDHRAAARDALVRVVRAVLHQLLGSHVRHEAHEAALRSASTASTAEITSASGTSLAPTAVTTTMIGHRPRVASGPPVAESSSAASISASAATRSAASRSRPGRHRFLSEFFAGCPPDPVVW